MFYYLFCPCKAHICSLSREFLFCHILVQINLLAYGYLKFRVCMFKDNQIACTLFS